MMSTTSNVSAGKRIEALLDDNSFVEIGSLVTARNTDFNLTEKENEFQSLSSFFRYYFRES